MKFKDNLKKCREQAGFKSAKEFAAQIGVNYSTYIGYEAQGREPRYEILMKIADTLGITTDELLGYVPTYNLKQTINKYRAINVKVANSKQNKDAFIVTLGHNRYWVASETDLRNIYNTAMNDADLKREVKRSKVLALEKALFNYRHVGVTGVQITAHESERFSGKINFSLPIGWKEFSGDFAHTGLNDDDGGVSIIIDTLGVTFMPNTVNILKDDIAQAVIDALQPYYKDKKLDMLGVFFVDELQEDDELENDFSSEWEELLNETTKKPASKRKRKDTDNK